MSPSRPKPVVLCILDGFGWREEKAHNAVAQAALPVFRALWQDNPHALLNASEEHVGLPAGQMGNSEVGHMNLGAGRVVFQDLPMINRAIDKGEIKTNPALLELIAKLKKSGGTCHLMGLLSKGGVHAYDTHALALAREIAGAGVPVAVHAYLDGRDVPPQSAAETLPEFLRELNTIKGAKLATLCGRYYALDRDKRWERVEKAYDMLVDATGAPGTDAEKAIRDFYAADPRGDEFFLPVVMNGTTGMKDGDGVLMFNYRTDRAREILTALLDPAFNGFARKRVVKFAATIGMVEYSAELNKLMGTLFPPKSIKDGLGEVVSRAGLKQLRIAETEKYPHVTFFFNGGEEKVYDGEDRILVPSPKVATYDMQPEMSAAEVGNKVVEAIEQDKFDFIVVNFANPDMVGHTGVLAAAVRALEALDVQLGRLVDAVRKRNGAILVTADHGNCEMMFDPETNQPHTAHTLNRVPAVLVGGAGAKKLKDGKLADVAPTLLELMGLPQPALMEGMSLISRS